ncbi:MAG TPA: TPM domain-containing protein [Candidatus Tetragenococcus pullicola]|nr:TPM domain-containing protein [Candidatus Tetragenococcus pullicola]
MNNSNAKKAKGAKVKRTENYYHRVKKINTISIIVCSLLLLGGLFFFVGGLPKLNSVKKEQQQTYQENIAYYQAEKEQIENELDASKRPSFEESIKNQEDYYDEFDGNEDFYEVEIEDSGKLKINRNNIFVSDNANVLSADVKKKVYELNRQLNETANGAQFMVVTLAELPNGESIESYATAIFNTLGIGNSEEDNGILYLMAIDEQETRLEVGYGMEGSLTDAISQDILDDDDVVDAYQDEEYNDGVNQTVDLVEPYINTKTPEQDAAIRNYEGKLRALPYLYAIPVVIIAILALIAVLYLWSILKSRRLFNDDYQNLLKIKKDDMGSPTEANHRIEKLALYKLAIYGVLIWQTYGHVVRSRDIGKVLQRHPEGKRVGRNVLVGEVLYDYRGRVLTRAYSQSSYSGNSSSSSGGGFGGGSFGGGSSGGGGASGGW